MIPSISKNITHIWVMIFSFLVTGKSKKYSAWKKKCQRSFVNWIKCAKKLNHPPFKRKWRWCRSDFSHIYYCFQSLWKIMLFLLSLNIIYHNVFPLLFQDKKKTPNDKWWNDKFRILTFQEWNISSVVINYLQKFLSLYLVHQFNFKTKLKALWD